MSKNTMQPILKHDTPENWAKAKNYIPPLGTIVVYDIADGCPHVKFGDGVHTVNELGFLSTDNSYVKDDILTL